jgi:hypothetical protein
MIYLFFYESLKVIFLFLLFVISLYYPYFLAIFLVLPFSKRYKIPFIVLYYLFIIIFFIEMPSYEYIYNLFFITISVILMRYDGKELVKQVINKIFLIMLVFFIGMNLVFIINQLFRDFTLLENFDGLFYEAQNLSLLSYKNIPSNPMITSCINATSLIESMIIYIYHYLLVLTYTCNFGTIGDDIFEATNEYKIPIGYYFFLLFSVSILMIYHITHHQFFKLLRYLTFEISTLPFLIYGTFVLRQLIFIVMVVNVWLYFFLMNAQDELSTLTIMGMAFFIGLIRDQMKRY